MRPLSPVDRNEQVSVSAADELPGPVFDKDEVVDAWIFQEPIEAIDGAVQSNLEPPREGLCDGERSGLPGDCDGYDDQAQSFLLLLMKGA